MKKPPIAVEVELTLDELRSALTRADAAVAKARRDLRKAEVLRNGCAARLTNALRKEARS